MLTGRQKQILDFIEDRLSKKGIAPTHQEIARKLGVSSVATVHEHLQALQKKGYLKKDRGRARALAPQTAPATVSIPLLGTIAAGQPIEASEVSEERIEVPIDRNGSANLYALRVQGNSMIEEGIFDGDVVVIKKQNIADNGQTVVAIIDDNEATLKKLYREKNGFRLQPANPTLFPIYRKEVEIRGVVVKILRNLGSETDGAGEKFTRRIDDSWDYRGEKTKSYTHGIHPYPAMFIPQVGRRLLETYSKPGDTVCDIFCGSGTALVECKLLGRNAYGIDLNPLAIFLAKAKTTPIDPKDIFPEYRKVLTRVEKIKDSEVEAPKFKNIDFWFKARVILKLAKLKRAIQEAKGESVKNFLLVAFSETVRFASNTKTGEFKLVRIHADKLLAHDPDVIALFRKFVEKNMGGMADFYKEANKGSKISVLYGDSSKSNNIKGGSIDCIVTSPPYGDSRTTVAYGQFSRLSAQWLDLFNDLDAASAVDNNLLGGKAAAKLSHSLPSKYLSETLDAIAKQDENRAKDVLSFYLGLYDCFMQAYKMLGQKKYFCVVIGNRLVKQVRIPTDFIVAELAESIGFTCEDIIVRNIPGKRMPIRNSPTNVKGALEETMNKESIVILRKN